MLESTETEKAWRIILVRSTGASASFQADGRGGKLDHRYNGRPSSMG